MLHLLDFKSQPPPTKALNDGASHAGVRPQWDELRRNPLSRRSNEGFSERTAGFRLGSRHHRRQEPRLGSAPPTILQKLPPERQRVCRRLLPCLHLTPDLKCLARCLQHPAKNHCIAEPTRAVGNKRETGGALSHPGGSVGALCDITEGPHMLPVDLLLSFFVLDFLYSKFCIVVF